MLLCVLLQGLCIMAVAKSSLSGRVSFGAGVVDDILGGGLSSDGVTMVYGPPGSGKTSFVFTAATTVALGGDDVLIVDTESVSTERLHQIASERGGGCVDEVMERIQIASVETFADQTSIVSGIESAIDSVGLIVVDSLTALYRRGNADRDGASEQSDALDVLSKQVLSLLGVARRNDIPVVVTNQVQTDPETESIVPVGGRRLYRWMGDVLHLQQQGPATRILERVDTMQLSPQERHQFRITDAGIESTSNQLFSR